MLRLDEPDPAAAWDERIAALQASATALNGRRFDAIELHGPGDRAHGRAAADVVSGRPATS